MAARQVVRRRKRITDVVHRRLFRNGRIPKRTADDHTAKGAWRSSELLRDHSAVIHGS
jgi:hypothetical protein